MITGALVVPLVEFVMTVSLARNDPIKRQETESILTLNNFFESGERASGCPFCRGGIKNLPAPRIGRSND